MNINGWFLKTLFTIFVVLGVTWLHFFIASDKLGDDILNSYALLIVVLSFYVKDENGKERETLKYYIDITTVIVSIAITFELVYVKLYDKGDPMDIVKGFEMFLCAWIFYGVFIANGKTEKKLEDTQ
ncbi:hypothetical protein [Pantoea sp. 1B4]|uniref:hypothetical protein n=1 Tax=Pantoea sp. 1B4 TaxID=2804760 RepID=UPI001AAA93F7|nr:hypothetical protein [Pantoea sp. 1B4]MBN1091117.1 hypothetical protein [Pantoea sp. 1B4]